LKKLATHISAKAIKIIFGYLVLLNVNSTTAQAQTNAWYAANDGLGNVEEEVTFEVEKILTLENGIIYSFISKHSDDSEKEGAFKYNPADNTWDKIAPRLNQYGFSALVSSGTRIFAIPGGNSQTIFELDESDNQWVERIELPEFGLALSRGIDAVGNKIFIPCRIEGDEVINSNAALDFKKTEEFIIEVDVELGNYTLLRNQTKPLLIPSKGGNPKNPIALKNGKVYHYSTFDYRENDGFGGLYEWNGSEWISASAGLNAINITGNKFGPIGPIFTDNEHSKLFIKTEQGFYEKTDGGWFKYFYRTSAILGITKDYIFIENSNGGFSRVDQAVNIAIDNAGLGCISRISHFTTPDNGKTFLAEVFVSLNGDGGCADDKSNSTSKGIYRFNADFDGKGKVKNLHLETGTYLGGQGANKIAETAILSSGKVLVAGNFNDDTDEVTTPLAVDASSDGKILVLNETGTSVEKAIVLGANIWDMDTNKQDEVAVIGDFGLVVLNSDLTLKWHVDDATAEGSVLSIDEEGKVIAQFASANEGAGILKLFNATGAEIHQNNSLDNNGVQIFDVAINAAQNQYLVAGYTQVSSVLQVAFLRAFSLQEDIVTNWKTWGFSSEEVNTNQNGADTRLYHIVATDTSIVVAGESAGGGPGGFTIFAYNGKDLTTTIAENGNDYFTDGTNSCGPCHITFLGNVNPGNGTVTNGKFFHGRLSGGKTNTHRVRMGDLALDDQGNVLVVGEAAFQIEDRDVFNVNGNLVGAYAGDQYVLMTTPDFQKRLLWGVFSKEKGNGTENRLAFGNGKVAYLAQTNKGTMITSENAMRANPYNNIEADGSLADSDVYFALWNSRVWETANNDEVSLAFISADSCFRADDEACRSENPAELPFEDKLKPFNQITPNGDGRNDSWQIEGLGLFNAYRIVVVNRNGQVVFESDNYNQDWQGTSNGQPLPAGVYYYAISVDDTNKVRKGYLTILY